MALRDSPYIPFYVQDFLTDEKLAECSAQSTGVYIRLMCLLHKSETYGAVLLKQKDKQNENKILDFACKFARQMPYSVEVIFSSLTELLEEKVISIENDMLFQKRMVKDGKISNVRANAGKKGGTHSQKSREQNFASDFASDFAYAKSEANSENENEYEYEDKYKEENGDLPVKEPSSDAREGKFESDSKPYMLAKYLEKQIMKRLALQKEKPERTLQSWADSFDKCNRIDGHPWEEISRVLQFSQNDSFWSSNILSGKKFREKYEQLLAKMVVSSAQKKNSRNEQYQKHGTLSEAGKAYVREILEKEGAE